MSLSAGYKNFGYNYITTYNSLGISDGEVSPREMSIVIGVAYKLTNKLSVGLNANYISSDLIYKDASAVAFDISATYIINNINMGISSNKIGNKIEYGNNKNDLPYVIKAGGKYTL